jgi:hypothetical protein
MTTDNDNTTSGGAGHEAHVRGFMCRDCGWTFDDSNEGCSTPHVEGHFCPDCGWRAGGEA